MEFFCSCLRCEKRSFLAWIYWNTCGRTFYEIIITIKVNNFGTCTGCNDTVQSRLNRFIKCFIAERIGHGPCFFFPKRYTLYKKRCVFYTSHVDAPKRIPIFANNARSKCQCETRMLIENRSKMFDKWETTLKAFQTELKIGRRRESIHLYFT